MGVGHGRRVFAREAWTDSRDRPMETLERPEVRSSAALPGQSLNTSLEPFAPSSRTADHQDGVFAAERAQNVREALKVEGLGNRLRPAGHRLEDEQLPDTIHRGKELWKHIVQRCPGLLRGVVGRCIPDSARRRYPRQAEFTKVSREGRLRHLKPTEMQQATQLLLTGNGLRLDYLENEAMALLLLHDLEHLGWFPPRR